MAELISWFDPTSQETPLNNENGILALVGRMGFFAPPTVIVEDLIPLQPGSREKFVQVQPNDVKLPIVITAPTEALLAQARRTLKYAMNPQRGVGFLRHTAADGQIRDLTCRMLDGFRGDESYTGRGPGNILLGLTFHAAYPYWADSGFTTLNFAVTGTPPLFLATPFLPIQLGASGISTSFSIDNTGDVAAWPIWTITGPGVNPILRNGTTGETLTTTISLTAGQVLTIDTRPGKKTVTREDGSNQFATVTSTSSLWALQTGANVISLSMSSTSGASLLQLQYKQQYEGV